MRESDFLQSIVSQALAVQDTGKFEGSSSNPSSGFSSSENDSYVESMVSTFFSKIENAQTKPEIQENQPRPAATKRENSSKDKVLLVSKIYAYSVQEDFKGENLSTRRILFNHSISETAFSIKDLISKVERHLDLVGKIDASSVSYIAEEGKIFMRAIVDADSNSISMTDQTVMSAWESGLVNLYTTNIWVDAQLYSISPSLNPIEAIK